MSGFASDGPWANLRTTIDRTPADQALKSHGLADCLAAVRNIGADPWAGGANDRGKPFNGIEHALGSAERIERWRDAVPVPLRGVPGGKYDAAAAAKANRGEAA